MRVVGELASLADTRCGPGFADLADRRARAICALCPVWQECLLHGLNEKLGRWGGLNRTGRARFRRLRQGLATDLRLLQNGVDVRDWAGNGLSLDRLGVESAGLDDLAAQSAASPSPAGSGRRLLERHSDTSDGRPL